MKICVYGAGAVGGLIASRLARSGHEVSVVARGAHLEAIRARGLRVRDGAARPVESQALRAEDDPSRLGPQDYVVVAVKAQGLCGVAERIAPLVGAGTSIITAMNGVPWWFFDRLPFGGGKLRLETLDPAGNLARAMPTERIVGCVIHLAASLPEPGLVSHNMGRKLILGEPGGRNGLRTKNIADALTAAGFEVTVSDFIEKDFWVKLLGNVSFNPVSALTVSTETGLKLTLPRSLTQKSFSMNSLTVTSKPAAVSASAMFLVRRPLRPPGSPRMSLRPMLWLTSPGSGNEAARWITQPTMRSVGMARARLPAGSSVSSLSFPPPKGRRSKNHHGTPFIAVMIEVPAPTNGAIRSATSQRPWAFTATTT